MIKDWIVDFTIFICILLAGLLSNIIEAIGIIDEVIIKIIPIIQFFCVIAILIVTIQRYKNLRIKAKKLEEK